MMKITELEIHNIKDCKHAHIKLQPDQPSSSSIFLLHSTTKCEVISLALQLICSTKYATISALNEVRNEIVEGKVNITFTLPKNTATIENAEPPAPPEHSSDSDVPCTSKQAQERHEKRSSRARLQESRQPRYEIKACRNFAKDPDIIEYSVNDSARIECSALAFQIRFFNCTELFFPRLMDMTHGEYCQGRWLDLMSMEFIDKDRDENDLIKQFCELYGNRKLTIEDPLSQLTTLIVTVRNSLNHARISTIIKIFKEIRFVFEYITNSDYTVWFLLPSVFGNMIDISRITNENINFDLMKTEVQLKNTKLNIPRFPWTQAEGHIQELLLVAIQLVFGYNYKQNIIYLHSLNKELLRSNYFQRILNICEKLNVCCVIEYIGGLPLNPRHAHIINCVYQDASNEWIIFLKSTLSNQNVNRNIKEFLEVVDKTLK